MRNWRIGAVVTAALALAGCDNGPSAVETRERAAEAAVVAAGGPGAAAASPAGAAGSGGTATAPPGPRGDGRPLWSATSRYDAQANARRAFERNGAAFDAATLEAYVGQAHDFIAEPPPGTQTLRRANGDTLYYHAASNTFAVATAEGAPRTLFKPDEGAAYWAEQQQREAARGG